ncbi:MAG: hypothetical protein A3F35_01145 [Candidatus Woykebacteria bacterium RIFCSPHIGHO2_12_FULL_45_10]|uniref:Uncharacterized protein n=1 Tax=Candidatus Woykebacteria bacterium RIFCSPHIGHO2_12_FULL_45_10 TaxID=1802603 RepID=A0A1G1WNI2_9BACT|nr:MAG: hypothetical protein A3F35_01145 [Candidatus Woykebacteria bacterium RIFCSPHIGHO2_12_FULL_45_10]
MPRFEFRKDPINREWFVIAPQRSSRPNVAGGKEPLCPFCPGNEKNTPKEILRIGKGRSRQSGWEVRVVHNKFPFAPIHELIIHSPGHTESFFTYRLEQIKKIFHVYRQRSQAHEGKGQIVIFHNHGRAGAESLPHSHTQLAVVPPDVIVKTPTAGIEENVIRRTKHFIAFSPQASGWPGEVWIVPARRGRFFSTITDQEIADLSKLVPWVLKKLEKVTEIDFPFNFYIFQGSDWYLRIIPRLKVLGGFELATGLIVNSADPAQLARKIKG